MEIGRRTLLKVLGAFPLLAAGISGMWQRIAFAATPRSLALRKVTSSDAAYLEAIMNSCVSDADAFHGRCNPWSLNWAEKLIARRPESLVITRDDVPVAFQDIPSIRPQLPPLSANASAEEQKGYALRQANRATFRITAAGVRSDLLSLDEAVRMFRRILYYSAKAAHEIGYSYVECVAPWDQHPKMPRRWSDYPGCGVVYHARNQANGADQYWLRWRLDDQIASLAEEGADDDHLQVA